MAATATAELNKLSLADLTDKFDEAKNKATELAALETRDVEQDAELTDILDEADAIREVIAGKKKSEVKNRLDGLNRFDVPKPRKAGGAGSDSSNRFSCLGERLSMVAKARITGSIDPRLFNALGANEATPSDGGFLVGTDSETELMSKVYGDSMILSAVQRTPISANSNMLKLRLLKENSRADGSRQGGVQAYWEDEADSTTASRQKYEQLELTLRKLMAVSYATSELLEDYAALESEMDAGFREEMTFKLENAIINGDGAAKPKGILASPAKITVSAESGQTSSTPLMYENICNMWARFHPRSQMSGVWLVDQTLIPALFQLSLAGGTASTPVYLPPTGAAGAPYGTLFGRPVIHCEHTQAKNTEGDIILWDPKSYRVIEKGGVKAASSLHVAFLTDEMAYRWTYRVNGAPKWYSALTPKNGGDTLSTIVTLATRT